MRLLIVNADDLGYDPEIDRGIFEAHVRGIVTSTTAMVGTPFSASALRSAPATLGVGLHAVLGPGLPAAEVERTLRDQIARFEDLRGAPPSHLDSHKHAHAEAPALAAFVRVARERGLPVRAIDDPTRAALRAGGVPVADCFLGDAGLRPAWTEERLAAAIAALGEGTAEVMAHPGYRPSHARTSFGVEREVELAALCAPSVRAAVERAGVRLCGYGALRSYR